MKPSRSIPLVLLILATLACTIQSQVAARPALTPSPAPVVATMTTTPTRAPEPTPTRPAALACAVSTGLADGWLNLRAGPGMAYSVLQVLQEGQRVTLLDPGAWAHVQTLSGQTGWVYAAFLECNP